MSVFKLPDLGEGLPDAEIVKWHVKEGDTIEEGDLMVEMSTAKAVVEVPAPESGTVGKLHGGPGDVINTGDALVTFGAVADEAPVKEEAKEEKAEAPAEGATGSVDGQDFLLPDLGEGLPDAEIVKWLVAEGDTVAEDDVIVEMSTAKAVVEVPAPHSGTVTKLYGGPGDVIETGKPLLAIASGDVKVTPKKTAPKSDEKDEEERGDSGTVVGAVTVGTEVTSDAKKGRDGVIAGAAVRAMAKKLKVDLTSLKGSGPDGAVTMADVKTTEGGSAPATPSAPTPATPSGPKADDNTPVGPGAKALMASLGLAPTDITPTGPKGCISKQDVLDAAKARMSGAPTSAAPAQSARTGSPLPLSSGYGVKAAPKVRAMAAEQGIDLTKVTPTGHDGNVTLDDVNAALKADFTVAVPAGAPYQMPQRAYEVTGEAEKLVGPRRVMAQMMAKASSEVCHTSIFDEADIADWPQGTDITVRIMRSIIAASMVEPAINAHFNGETMEKTIKPSVNLGVAVDSPKGLFVPVIKGAETLDGSALRAELNRHRDGIKNGTIQPSDMSGGTITLSNFGMIAGKFATPIVSPPEIAIVGIGGLDMKLKMTEKGIENRRHMPVSLTFDHRAATGGEAARFLAAIIADLESVN